MLATPKTLSFDKTPSKGRKDYPSNEPPTYQYQTSFPAHPSPKPREKGGIDLPGPATHQSVPSLQSSYQSELSYLSHSYGQHPPYNSPQAYGQTGDHERSGPGRRHHDFPPTQLKYHQDQAPFKAEKSIYNSPTPQKMSPNRDPPARISFNSNEQVVRVQPQTEQPQYIQPASKPQNIEEKLFASYYNNFRPKQLYQQDTVEKQVQQLQEKTRGGQQTQDNGPGHLERNSHNRSSFRHKKGNLQNLQQHPVDDARASSAQHHQSIFQKHHADVQRDHLQKKQLEPQQENQINRDLRYHTSPREEQTQQSHPNAIKIKADSINRLYTRSSESDLVFEEHRPQDPRSPSFYNKPNKDGVNHNRRNELSPINILEKRHPQSCSQDEVDSEDSDSLSQSFTLTAPAVVEGRMSIPSTSKFQVRDGLRKIAVYGSQIEAHRYHEGFFNVSSARGDFIIHASDIKQIQDRARKRPSDSIKLATQDLEKVHIDLSNQVRVYEDQPSSMVAPMPEQINLEPTKKHLPFSYSVQPQQPYHSSPKFLSDGTPWHSPQRSSTPNGGHIPDLDPDHNTYSDMPINSYVDTQPINQPQDYTQPYFSHPGYMSQQEVAIIAHPPSLHIKQLPVYTLPIESNVTKPVAKKPEVPPVTVKAMSSENTLTSIQEIPPSFAHVRLPTRDGKSYFWVEVPLSAVCAQPDGTFEITYEDRVCIISKINIIEIEDNKSATETASKSLSYIADKDPPSQTGILKYSDKSMRFARVFIKNEWREYKAEDLKESKRKPGTYVLKYEDRNIRVNKRLIAFFEKTEDSIISEEISLNTSTKSEKMEIKKYSVFLKGEFITMTGKQVKPINSKPGFYRVLHNGALSIVHMNLVLPVIYSEERREDVVIAPTHFRVQANEGEFIIPAKDVKPDFKIPNVFVVKVDAVSERIKSCLLSPMWLNSDTICVSEDQEMVVKIKRKSSGEGGGTDGDVDTSEAFTERTRRLKKQNIEYIYRFQKDGRFIELSEDKVKEASSGSPNGFYQIFLNGKWIWYPAYCMTKLKKKVPKEPNVFKRSPSWENSLRARGNITDLPKVSKPMWKIVSSAKSFITKGGKLNDIRKKRFNTSEDNMSILSDSDTESMKSGRTGRTDRTAISIAGKSGIKSLVAASLI